MTGILGLDYAGGRPSGAAIAAAGYGFCVRYLTAGGPSLPGKLLTAAEYADLAAHGIAVAVVWETTADRMKAGWAAGVADAKAAVMMAARLGHPTDKPVYFAADWNATPGDQPSIDAYLDGAASVIGLDRVGIYGGYWPVKRALDNGTATWAWQTMAWSGNNRESRAHLVQRIGTVTVGGVACDVNEALVPDFGQHPCDAPPTSRSRRRAPGMELPPTKTRIDKQLATDIVGGWCGAANLLLTANTGGATVYGVYAVAYRNESTPPLVTTLLKDDKGRAFTQWWPLKAALPAGTTSVIVNYTADQGMVAHAEYEH